jgi:hypothetical protein
VAGCPGLLHFQDNGIRIAINQDFFDNLVMT